jgi:hypothetical protein
VESGIPNVVDHNQVHLLRKTNRIVAIVVLKLTDFKKRKWLLVDSCQMLQLDEIHSTFAGL